MAKISLQPVGSQEALEVAIERSPSGAEIRYGDTVAHVEWRQCRTGACWLRVGHRVIPYFVNRDGDRIEVWLDGRVHVFTLANQRARRAGPGAKSAALGDVVAPMPGTVIALKVGAGDAFEAHQPLVVMESMKMEMMLSAPAAGRVKEVCCSVGQLVDMNAVLVRLEADDA
jgi:acetyl/propionyl-CoA carboxylase alpha subunit